MTRAWPLVPLLAVAVFAGCIDPGTPDDESLVLCPVSPLDQPSVRYVPATYDPLANLTRDNALDFETTNVRTCSLPAIGHSVLNPTGTPHHYLGEIDMRGDLDLGAVAVLGNQEAPVVYLVDISNRSAPTVISSIPHHNTYIVDVKISDDGALLFTASQTLPLSPELEGLPELNAPTGFSIYDISDPANPRYVNFVQDSGYGCHMMSHEIIGGTDVLFCISQHVRAYRLDRAGGTVVSTGFVDYLPSDDSGMPRPAQPINPVGAPIPGGLFMSGPHDITVQMDDETGQTLGLISHWNAGLRIIDLSDAPLVTELGKWMGDGAMHYQGNVHTAMMFYAEGKRYIMASPEYTFEGAVPSLWVLDATDFADLKLVGEWYHPGEHESNSLFLTTHQWQVAPTGTDVNASDVRIYLTMNHGGLWVLDLGAILAGDNQGAILGYNLARTPIAADNPVNNAMLATWDVNVVDGYIYGSDRGTGLWVFHYANDTLGDAHRTGFA